MHINTVLTMDNETKISAVCMPAYNPYVDIEIGENIIIRARNADQLERLSKEIEHARKLLTKDY